MNNRRAYTIYEMTVEYLDAATLMRLESWLDTYVNDDAGVTKQWIEERNKRQVSKEVSDARRERFLNGKREGKMNAWVAKDENGVIIGATTPYIDNNGVQRLGSLYVEKSWHGSGVAGALMQKVINWFDDSKDIYLGVATYNERAKAFYRKWGFEEVPGSGTLFDGKIPEIQMIRKAKP